MFRYAIVAIAGRQYKISPDATFLVDYLGDQKSIECNQVLLKVEGDKLDLGKPFLNEKLIFDVIETIKSPKIRVATYKAKANTRKVKGARSLHSKLKLRLK